MGLPTQEYWSRLPFPSPADLPGQGIELESPVSSALVGRFFNPYCSPRGKKWLLWLVNFRWETRFSHSHSSFSWEPAGPQRADLQGPFMPRMISSFSVLPVVPRVNPPKSWMHQASRAPSFHTRRKEWRRKQTKQNKTLYLVLCQGGFYLLW